MFWVTKEFGHIMNVSYIFLLGFSSYHNFNIVLFVLMLIVYCVTICGNVLIITLVSVSNNLHSPMYFFITVISVLDLLMTMDILPLFLYIILHGGVSMPLVACISQLYVFANAESLECLILTVMSYDRYVAICNPLRYNSIINKMFCVKSVLGSWLLSFLMMLMNEIATNELDFCGPNIIDHFFCDLSPILELSCSDTLIFQILGGIICISVIMCPFILAIVSYIYIITTILNIRSISGRQKAFSTCSSHLTAVSMFYLSLFSVYIVPNKGKLLAISKILSLLYTVVVPLLNPFIYTLRNKDFKYALKKLRCYFT